MIKNLGACIFFLSLLTLAPALGGGVAENELALDGDAGGDAPVADEAAVTIRPRGNFSRSCAITRLGCEHGALRMRTRCSNGNVTGDLWGPPRATLV